MGKPRYLIGKFWTWMPKLVAYDVTMLISILLVIRVVFLVLKLMPINDAKESNRVMIPTTNSALPLQKIMLSLANPMWVNPTLQHFQ